MRLREGWIRLAAWPVLILVFCSAAPAQHTRTVQGKVLTADGEDVKGAIVQLEDTRTLVVRSYITERDGSYRFLQLSPDVDYEIVARYRGRTSAKKIVSQFDSRPIVTLNLFIKHIAP
jgi:carboxypeptidase family protein